MSEIVPIFSLSERQKVLLGGGGGRDIRYSIDGDTWFVSLIGRASLAQLFKIKLD